MKRTATAEWNGAGKEGKGNLSTPSNVLGKASYSWYSRFSEGDGTNPEELIAAAHAGCFSMKLAAVLKETGFTSEKISTSCTIDLIEGTITESHLHVKAITPGIERKDFEKCVEEAKADCPVSKAFNINITVDSELVET